MTSLAIVKTLSVTKISDKKFYMRVFVHGTESKEIFANL